MIHQQLIIYRLLSAHPRVTRSLSVTRFVHVTLSHRHPSLQHLSLHHYSHCTITHSCSRPITHASAAHLHKTSHLLQNLLNNTDNTMITHISRAHRHISSSCLRPPTPHSLDHHSLPLNHVYPLPSIPITPSDF